MRWWERPDLVRKPLVHFDDTEQWWIVWRCCAPDNVWARHSTNAGPDAAGWRLAIRWATQHMDTYHGEAKP